MRLFATKPELQLIEVSGSQCSNRELRLVHLISLANKETACWSCRRTVRDDQRQEVA